MDNSHYLGGTMTREELNKKILSYFPDANYEIINWDGYTTHPITLKCLDCGITKTYTRIHGIWSRKNRFCSSCSETVSQREVKRILKEKGYVFLRWANTKDINGKIIFRVEFKCPNCGQITNRRVWEFLHADDLCGHCGTGHRIKKTHEYFLQEINTKFPQTYEILDEYTNAHEKIKIRHLKCGFIFKIAPTALLSGQGCPRCNRYNSKGSIAIKNWLTEHSLDFEVEKKFSWSEEKRYDFYVPSCNLLIEFNGKQHYEPIPFFLQSRSFEEQQQSDLFKKQSAEKYGYNFLVIKYDEVKEIPQILSNTTTIYNRVESSDSKQ